MSSSFSRRRLLGAAASLAAVGSVAERAELWARSAPVRRARRSAHFVFVHGIFHGAWCWYKVTAALEAAGHRTTALDLPGGGIDATPGATVTLAAQAARVLEALDAAEEPVVLVGHSAGGPVISTVAEARPEKVAKLVFLTAFLLPAGSSIATAVAGDPDTLITPNLVGNPDGTVFLRPESIREVFYGTCSDADVALASAVLKPMGLQPSATPLAVGAAFAGVRRFYVHCRRDRAVGFSFQQAMEAALPCERTFTINSDHSPFLSRPAALVRALAAIARR
jgi:pimeloyl-ACP methyl ester carboxylesterase